MNVTYHLEWEHRFTFPFLCSSQLSQQVITGHNFCNTFNIGTIWTAADVMSLTYEGKPIAQCIRTKGINALVFCAESIVIPPYSNARIPCKAPKLKSHSNMGHSIVFEPLYRHRSNYIDCHTYEGSVTLDEHTASSGSFAIIMTNKSNRYVKVTKNETLRMLQSCDSDQICTIHRILIFEPKPLEREGANPNHSKNIKVIISINTQPVNNNTPETQNMTKDNNTKILAVAKDFYQIPTRNRHGEIEVLTLLKDNVSSVNKITDTAFEEEFVSHKKSKLQDAPKNKTRIRIIIREK